jgi:hypothetical protein
MVTEDVRSRFLERGIPTLPVEHGTDIFCRQILSPATAPAQVVVGDNLAAVARIPAKSLVRRTLTVIDLPFVRDHQINGRPVLPAAWVLAWMVQICESICPGKTVVEGKQFQIFHGIVFETESQLDVVFELSTVHQDASTVQIEVLLRTRSGRDGFRPLYRAELLLAGHHDPPHSGIVTAPIDTAVSRLEWSDYRQGLIRFGPAFDGVRSVLELSDRRVVTKCRLPKGTSDFVGAFPYGSVHPLAIDLATHGILIWLQKHHWTACLPAKTELFRVYRTISDESEFFVTLDIVKHDDSTVEFGFTTHDEDGVPYYEAKGVQMILTKSLQSATLR